MSARTPEEICRLFRQYMQAGDVDAVMTLYQLKRDYAAVRRNRKIKKATPLEALRSA